MEHGYVFVPYIISSGTTITDDNGYFRRNKILEKINNLLNKKISTNSRYSKKSISARYGGIKYLNNYFGKCVPASNFQQCITDNKHRQRLCINRKYSFSAYYGYTRPLTSNGFFFGQPASKLFYFLLMSFSFFKICEKHRT
jgi:hypothetical protein